MAKLHCQLADLRRKRGWTQGDLAERTGVSRPEISAIETARLVPSALVALKLAAALGASVESLFSLAPPEPALDWAWPPEPGDQRVWEATVGRRSLVYPAEATAAGALRHDGRAAGSRLDRLPGAPSPERTLVVAGCDPMVGLLAAEVAARSDFRVLPLTRSSGDALDLLRRGLVHMAGLHLGDESGHSLNEETARARVGPGHRLLHVVRWEEGVAVARGRARSVGRLLGARTRWVNREEGSGARRCLDRLLGTRPHPPGYERIVRDHRSLAATISSGWAEAGVCLRPVAIEARLDFLPVQREAYELCFPDALMDDPRIEALLKAVRSASYRLLLKDVPGWDTRQTGDLRAVA
jgi:molybdate-binding protein/transcriptional regulator with XRE-family HTH domain